MGLVGVLLGVLMLGALSSTPTSFTARVSAYSYEACSDSRCLTRSGVPAHWGVVAVDPAVVPLGSSLTIEGLEGTFTALDTGGGIKGNMVDVWFPSTREALDWGVRYRQVTVLVVE